MKKIYILISIFSINTIAADYEPYESSYEPLPYTNTIFRNANIYDGDGKEFIDTDKLFRMEKLLQLAKIFLYLMI